jgi:putative component of toxin-antitoxin plasmid stabilization module
MPQLFAYRDIAGREPFSKWFQDLDAQAAAKVRNALAQLEAGNMSEVKPVGGGTKATQDRDVGRAAECWTDYKQRRDRGKK